MEPEKLHLTSDKVVTVQSLSKSIKTATVYNLTVEGNHNYFVSDKGVLVHNCGENLLTARAVAQKTFAKFSEGAEARKRIELSGFPNKLCAPCAQAYKSAFQRGGIKGNVISIRNKPGDYFMSSDAVKGKGITDNGYHYAVEVDGHIFDNINPNGIPKEKWVSQFFSRSKGQFTVDDINIEEKF